ncbi:antitoxin Xre/MbcA/ParS toxin-binding domain-containing protein [Spirosoma luteum]|uniref:antitoxin Xre/MbcA/ParS toxin-binding domain-containing protein n=1 Tax=Spirosoma luteum TaxID=431553 RepID=UPI00036B4B8B|nr:MbcA/ParS/Xre antitoxin family protein [Spirosoma luteum]
MKAEPSSPSKPTARRTVQIKPGGLDAQLNQLAQQFGVTLKELAPLLQLSESTLHRLRRQTTLSGPTAERVELLNGIFQHGLRVYGGDALAMRDWLRYPLAELEGRTPLQTLTTIAGFTQVDDVLGRIEHGIFF